MYDVGLAIAYVLLVHEGRCVSLRGENECSRGEKIGVYAGRMSVHEGRR